MKRILFLLIILFLTAFSFCFADENCDIRDYNGVMLAKGTLIPVISAQEISTMYCDEGTKVKFLSTTDLYLNEINAIPQNTEFFGYIEKINEPIIGTNASMIIRISKLKFCDGFEAPIKAYVFVDNSSLIGGELTAPTTFDQKVSSRQGYYTMIGSVPGPTRKMGEHKVIASGADVMIVLSAPFYVTHTVIN